MMENFDARKLDVTINTNQSEELDELSLADIFHALKKNIVKLVAWVLVGVLVGGLAGGAYVVLTQKQQVTTIVSFAFNGIERGLDPAGGVFDVAKIKAPVVVEAALQELGWAESVDVNAETIRQAITIESIVPQDVIDRLTVITTIATNAGSVSSLEKVLDEDYYPTRFKVTLDCNKLKLDGANACSLLNAVLDSYGKYFNDSYTDAKFLGTAMDALDYTDYDYTEVIDIIDQRLDMMYAYMSNLRNKDTNNSFRSIATGYSCTDILTSLDLLRSKDIAWLSALVYSYNLSSDRDLLKTYLNHQLDEYKRSLDSITYTYNAINAKINTYKKDTAMMVVSGEASDLSGQSLTLGSKEYDDLMEQSISAAKSVASINANIEKTTDRINKIEAAHTSLTSEEYEIRKQQASNRLATIARKMDGWVTIITDTATEFYETVIMKDAYKVLAPARDVSEGKLMSMVKYGGLGAAGCAGLVLLLYVIGTCFALITDDKPSKKSDKAAAV